MNNGLELGQYLTILSVNSKFIRCICVECSKWGNAIGETRRRAVVLGIHRDSMTTMERPWNG